MQLNEEQRQMVESALWAVNTALKRQGLSPDEDLRQATMLYLCECVQRFDSSKGVKWGTYAYKNAYLYIKRQHRAEIRRTTPIAKEDIQEFEGCLKDGKDVDLGIYTIDQIKAVLDPKERQIVDLLCLQYRKKEICEKLKMSRMVLREHIQSIREKIKENACYERERES